jgi:hypothetical protein
LSNADAAAWIWASVRVASLEADAREPPQRGALEPLRLGVTDDNADREGVAEVDARKLGGGVADQVRLPVLRAR